MICSDFYTRGGQLARVWSTDGARWTGAVGIAVPWYLARWEPCTWDAQTGRVMERGDHPYDLAGDRLEILSPIRMYFRLARGSRWLMAVASLVGLYHILVGVFT